MVFPSEWLFLDRDDVFEDKHARQRAKFLYDKIAAEVAAAPEFRHGTRSSVPGHDRATAETGEIDQDSWHIMAEVAEGYPRLLVWLTEGQVGNGSLHNVFGLFIAVLRLIPGVREVLRRVLFNPAAQLAPWRPALYEAFLQRERERYVRPAEAVQPMPPLVILPGGTPGLSAVTDVAVITQSSARDHLREKVVRMASGCIGVSGLRGSGKTTLIRDFCAHRYGTPRYLSQQDAEPAPLRGLRVVVDAPLRFDARDFLIYLYTCLCRTVLTDVRFTMMASREHLLTAFLLPRRIQPRAMLASLAGIGLLLLLIGLVYQATIGVWPALPWRSPFLWEVTGAVACLIALTSALGWRARQALMEVRQVIDLPAEARERLRRLHFQRTDSVSRGGKIAGPFGIGVDLSGGRSLTENVMSLPELIDDYRDFVERVVAALVEAEQVARRERAKRKDAKRKDAKQEDTAGPGDENAADLHDADAAAADVRLIIGIDSMDQIDDPEAAGKFLDELSAVFGTPNCVYLLSIQPATLAAVDQRTVPLKTSSAGLFDDMVWVEPLTFPEATKLLDSRVTGMPRAFVALCYVLSGGLPRELLRVARAVCSVGVESHAHRIRHIPLEKAVSSVISDEMLGLRHRAMASAASLDIGATPSWLKLIDGGEWLRRQTTAPPPNGVHWIQALLDEIGHPWAGAKPQKRTSPATDLCDALISGLYFLLTVQEIFTADPKLIHKLITPHSAGDGNQANVTAPALSHLANARLALGANPYLAADHVRAARRVLTDHADNTALSAQITLPFLRRDVGGAGNAREQRVSVRHQPLGPASGH
jgi:hypothetical protein